MNIINMWEGAHCIIALLGGMQAKKKVEDQNLSIFYPDQGSLKEAGEIWVMVCLNRTRLEEGCSLSLKMPDIWHTPWK